VLVNCDIQWCNVYSHERKSTLLKIGSIAFWLVLVIKTQDIYGVSRLWKRNISLVVCKKLNWGLSTWAPSIPCCIRGRSVCDQELVAQGATVRRSAEKLNRCSWLCTKLRTFQARSLCLQQKDTLCADNASIRELWRAKVKLTAI
jgi:hypothetical protein